MNKLNPKVTAAIEKSKKWQEEFKALRAILLSCGLTEEVKWNSPAYLFQDHIVIAVQGFKEYCALLFMKGVLIDDGKGILVKTGVNARVGRQIRFHKLQDITSKKTILKTYIKKAIKAEKDGLKVSPPKKSELDIPDEFQKKLYDMPELKEAFEALSVGKQKDYIFYFSAAKQSKTRESRIEKSIDMILDGEGLHDAYLAKAKSKKRS